MNPHLLEERVATVTGGPGLAENARASLAAHKATADACRRRTGERRAELDDHGPGGVTAALDPDRAALEHLLTTRVDGHRGAAQGATQRAQQEAPERAGPDLSLIHI